MSYLIGDDAWKGEHLIRSRRRPAPAPDDPAAPGSPRIDGREVAACRYPGCPALVKTDGATGLCAAHLHAPGRCTCFFCRRKRR